MKPGLWPARSATVLSCAALALLCALQALAVWRAPPAWFPAAISVTLAPGATRELGARELAAAQADTRHIGLRRDSDGHWWLRNLSAAKQVLLQRGELAWHSGALALQEGQRVRLGAAELTVGALDTDSVTLQHAGQLWRYDGATLYRDGRALAPCPEQPAALRAVMLWNRAAPRALALARPASLGGNLDCSNRLGIAQVGAGSATLARVHDQFVLSSAGADGARAPLMLLGANGQLELARREEPLQDVTAVTLGRTRLSVRQDGDQLILIPSRHVTLFAAAETPLPAGVVWRWEQRLPWTLAPGVALWLGMGLAAGALLATLLAWQGGRWPFVRACDWPDRAAALASALLAIAGLVALLLQRAGTPPGLGWSLLLGWAALWCCLLLPGRLTLATAAGMLLMATGLLLQLELGLGALESSWPRFFQKSVGLLALGLGVGAHLRVRLRTQALALPQTVVEALLAALAASALLALAAQVLWGDETGVFDLQPVEFAKLALCALAAHCLAVGLGWRHSARGPRAARWLRLGAPALLFLALLGLALVQVDDYSPLILLLVWCSAMALCYALAARKRLLGAGVIALALCAVGAIVTLRGVGGADLVQWGFYADRFLVWLDPIDHPHTGQQLLLGARAISEGAWWGADQRLGLSSLGQLAGSALRIPAVQDDFAAAFFLNRHGLLGGLALWLLQALFLLGVLGTAARAHAASLQARDFRQAWLARFRCFALCGGAGFGLGHFLLSWGTNLAIFPIMGQPMSFLSAGGSHLLFFLCPLLAFCAISAQSLEENESCRSMSNTSI